MQILWNNLVTEGLITVNLVMEPAESDEMKSKPIAQAEPLAQWFHAVPIGATEVVMTSTRLISELPLMAAFAWR